MPYSMYSPLADTYIPYIARDPNLTVTATETSDSVGISNWLLQDAGWHPLGRYGAAALGDVLFYGNSSGAVATTILHNVTSAHAIPVYLNELHRAAYAVVMGGNIVNYTIARYFGIAFVVNHLSKPLPLTGQEEVLIESLVSALAALFMLGIKRLFTKVTLVVPFSFVAANFVVFLVKEKTVKSKHLQVTCGVNIYGFWAANLAWDVLCFFIITIFVMIVFLLFNNEGFVGTAPDFFSTALLVFFYGIAG